WLWARTVKSPNPAFADVDVPLASTFMLSTKAGKEAYVEPVIEAGGYRFTVKVGQPKNAEAAKRGTKLARGANFQCVMSGTPMSGDHIKAQGMAGHMGARLMAIVAEGDRGRVYLAPTPEHEATAKRAKPEWKPETPLAPDPRALWTPPYGLTTFGDLFTPRQLVALTTFSDLVGEAMQQVRRDALAAGLSADPTPLRDGGVGATAYAEAVAVYLAFAVDKATDYWSTICTWHSSKEIIRNTFGRQAIPMVWDYAETNVFSASAGNVSSGIEWSQKAINMFPSPEKGLALQADAQNQVFSTDRVVSTDPPYCLAPGILIQTPEGYRPIECIQVGERVLTHSGRFAAVTRTYRRHYAGPIYRLKAAHTSQAMLITGEHPVYAIRTAACTVGYADYCHIECAWMDQNDGRCSARLADNYALEWIPAGEIRVNDLIFMPTLREENRPVCFDLADWLPEADYLEHEGALHYQKATARSLTRRETENAPPRRYAAPAQVALTPELCRLLGYFVAEGYARVEADSGAVHFTFHIEEREMAADVERLMAFCFGLHAGRVTDNRRNNNRSVRLNFYSKPVAQLLRRWCYAENGWKRLPEWALYLEPAHLRELVAGYWAGDGYRANGNYTASTNSPHLAGQLRLLLQRLHIAARLHVFQIKPTEINGNVVLARGSQYGLFVSGQSLLKLAEIAGSPKQTALSKRRFRHHGVWREGGYLLPIRAVERVEYDGPVYNLETEDHSYVTAAGCVHNCDNIGYADLSDFFYVWLRRSLRPVFPDLFATLAVPKAEELVSTPYRHGSKLEAEAFFLNGMTQAMRRLAEQAHPAFPVTIYYAYKQAETENARMPGMTFTGWETFLDAVIQAGFAITGTWPIRTELSNRMVGMDTNALASSIVLVCRQRAADAPTATRREFVAALKAELPAALAHLQRANIAPVDLAQAAIGPGMAVYTRYAQVLDAAGNPVPVREALALINQTLDEALAEQEGDFDADSRWALAWFEQHAFAEGEYGVAETLSKAKNTSVAGMMEAGILVSSRGKVRLLRPHELAVDWDPAKDRRLTAWESVHQLIRALDGGEAAAAELAAKLGSQAETARELAYRLYTLCERKKRAAEALWYNGLVQSWPEIVRLAQPQQQPEQARLDL
ncbi:MAG TPA: LAGLIDADG family homing endonuclease, partial [Anaerolineae bacterium]|nr:LAGLIDADG family homing endonuclease [Anaerolineae bacterium]